jgi:hypothetical protein
MIVGGLTLGKLAGVAVDALEIADDDDCGEGLEVYQLSSDERDLFPDQLELGSLTFEDRFLGRVPLFNDPEFAFNST